ncbi:MAG: cytochrome-c peroxidase, partial [Saprospiraceae bacterium]|nr:cytochrome-c peroxidase [Saprospiraceae bacterium]
MKHIIYSIIISCILFSSCKKDNDDSYDEQLEEALQELGQELSDFKLPNSDSYSAIPQDPNNPITKDKVELGKLLFHETAFATEGEFPITIGTYSCASCHHADAGFQSGIAQGIGEGGEGFGNMGEDRIRNLLCTPSMCDVQPIRTPTVLNGAYQPLMLWNGQFGATSLNEGTENLWTPDTPKETNQLGFEGLEIQAIAGLEVHRLGITQEAVTQYDYKEMFDAAFPEIAESERYNRQTAGLAIAAYERTIMANNAPFQKYINGDKSALTNNQKEGATLFFG